MFVLIKCDTCRVGCSSTEVYEFEDGTDDEALDTYASELAYENAEMYGILDDERESCEESGIEFNEGDCYSYEKKSKSSMEKLQMPRGSTQKPRLVMS